MPGQRSDPAGSRASGDRLRSQPLMRERNGMTDIAQVRRADFTVLRVVPTRWIDNDHYGHVNNVVYYSYFDTAVNGFLIEATGTDIRELPAIGIVAESGCQYLKTVSFPDTIHAGLSVERLGTSSVIYRIALFRNDEDAPCAAGRFVHVYVDRDTRRPVPVPAAIRDVVGRLKTA
jgi:acyl-CoA thioester hydrolase